jgi:hypothetical protein
VLKCKNKTLNRAGKGQNSNVLTSDPNINQPANKVAASTEAQNQFFSTKASSSPAPNPVMPPNMVPAGVGSGVGAGVSSGVGSPAGTFTSTGQGGSGATGINRENLFLNEAAAMYSDGPSKALVGNQDRLPEHLKAKIEAAPGMYGDQLPDPKKPKKQKSGEKYTPPKKQGFKDSKTSLGYPLGQSISLDKKDTVSYEMIPGKTTMENIGTNADGTPNIVPSTSYSKRVISNKDYANRMGNRVDRFKSPTLRRATDSPFEFTPGGTRTETGKRSKGGKTTTTYRRDGSKKSEFTEKDSGTKKETRYTGSPRSLSTKAVKVDVKDNATRTYTKYKRDGSVKKTMTANNKGGVDIKKAKKLRTKNQRAKKGTKLK